MSTTDTLGDLIARNGHVIADGAMGTQLFAAGLAPGESPEAWNLTHADALRGIHSGYLRAGAHLVLTNSFGGNRFRLALHGLADRCAEVNRAAARLAREAAQAEATRADRSVLVAGSMGPTGELLEPMGAMSAEDCEAAFREQARALCEGGADLLWVETMSDLRELEAAVRGVRAACELPVAATMSFDTAGRTMMGVSGAEMAERLDGLGLAALGANCGDNLDDTRAAVDEMAAAAAPLIFKPNAGVPVWQGETLVYDGTPELVAAHAHAARAAGASVIGSCCGSTPAHTAQIAKVLRGEAPPLRLAADAVNTRRAEQRPARRDRRRKPR